MSTTRPPSPELQRLRGGVRLYSDRAGELRIWSPRSGIIASQFAGRMSAGLAGAVSAYSDECFAAKRDALMFRGFHDWSEMIAYDPEARQHLMAWTLSVRGRIRELHFLVNSRLVHMALTVGNLTLSMEIQSYRDRDEFEQAMARSLAE